MRWLCTAALLSLSTIAALAQPQAGKFSDWKKNEKQNRWESTYTYPTNSGGNAMQLVVVYPKDSPRAGWAYFHNEQGKPWARCAIKGNPKFDPMKAYWQGLNKQGNSYEEFKDKASGFSPTPRDGKAPIPAPPELPS